MKFFLVVFVVILVVAAGCAKVESLAGGDGASSQPLVLPDSQSDKDAPPALPDSQDGDAGSTPEVPSLPD